MGSGFQRIRRHPSPEIIRPGSGIHHGFASRCAITKVVRPFGSGGPERPGPVVSYRHRARWWLHPSRTQEIRRLSAWPRNGDPLTLQPPESFRPRSPPRCHYLRASPEMKSWAQRPFCRRNTRLRRRSHHPATEPYLAVRVIEQRDVLTDQEPMPICAGCAIGCLHTAKIINS